MAGAVSAGAYTAGVMDYLTEALEEWEKRRGQPGVPTHRVQISVIGGASAGGMTGIIAAGAINQPFVPVPVPEPEALLKEHPENPFYHSWVDLLGDDMFRQMLDLSDIRREGKVTSVLNSDFIDAIADRTIRANPSGWVPAPAYFSEPLKLFTTLTNLEGIRYNIAFRSELLESRHNMTMHSDFACFHLNETQYGQQGWMPLDFKTGLNVLVARDAAIATGAFPIGLKSRIVNRTKAVVMQNSWINYTDTSPDESDQTTYTTQNVDGGLMNNEPFEKVKQLLNEEAQQFLGQEQEDYRRFRTAVLMIDPFPGEAPRTFKINQELLPTLQYLFNAITQQLRAKPSTLIDAMSGEKAGQYLIAPTRPVRSGPAAGTKIDGSKAIACGAMDGFSGFMHKEFRIHDYYLGRYNCEMFLRNYFTIPAEHLDAHPVFGEGYAMADRDRFRSFRKDAYQIIPIFSTYEPGYYPMPVFRSGTQWPMVEEKIIERYTGAIRKRVEGVIMNAVPMSRFRRFLLYIGCRVLFNKAITQKIGKLMLASLHKHGLVTGAEQVTAAEQVAATPMEGHKKTSS
jgi:hypothetical protein